MKMYPIPDFFFYFGPVFLFYFSRHLNVLMALLLCEQRAYGRITFHALCLFLKWIKLFFFLSSEDANILNVVQNIKTFAPLCGSEQMWALKKFGQFGPPPLRSSFKCISTNNAYQQIYDRARLTRKSKT